ncbi:MAG TPA: lysophospholipid acyltransferase family protein [Spirochaetia bacterium]|nr:lysophospholipid acyltransferase family protein [Spirochaetia bacterium]
MHRASRANYLFNRFLKITLGLALRINYRVSIEHAEVLKAVSPPFVVLPNHFTTWDPFILGCYLPGPVHNVTTDGQFRSRIMRIVHSLVGSIPKSKVIPDIVTIKRIMDIKRRRGIIGIYPEGKRSWDGHTTDISIATAKLLKLLKIPVVVPITKGGYLSLPRWSSHHRRGKMIIDFSLLFRGDELRSLSVEEIHAQVIKALEYDEYAFQREHMIPYQCKRGAETVERTLFMCPACESIATLHSSGDEVACSSCGYRIRYDEHGFFRPVAGPVRFETVRDWNLWQQGRLESLLSRHVESRNTAEIFDDADQRLHVGYRTNPPRYRAAGRMTLYRDRIEFEGARGDNLTFPMEEIEGTNVQIGEHLEFYHRNILYRLTSRDRSLSAFKWMSAIEILKRLWATDAARGQV